MVRAVFGCTTKCQLLSQVGKDGDLILCPLLQVEKDGVARNVFGLS